MTWHLKPLTVDAMQHTTMPKSCTDAEEADSVLTTE